MTKAPIILSTERRKAVETIFDPILSEFGLRNAFDVREIQIRDKVIVENIGNKNKLSNAVLDCMFPKESASGELFHYTTPAGLRGIASSGELRLYPILKRIGQGELDTFAIRHKLDGYLKGPGKPYFEELSKDLFYTSLARPGGGDEGYMWNVFADQGSGVRLKLRLAPQHADLRSIQYEKASRTLLNQLNDALAAETQPPFLPWTISRIGAFYLPSLLNVESELRLMMKRYEDGRDDTKSDGTYEYWPVPIGKQNDICNIDLIEIEPGAHARRPDVAAAVAGTALSGARIV
jgi:hypothetical protein